MQIALAVTCTYKLHTRSSILRYQVLLINSANIIQQVDFAPHTGLNMPSEAAYLSHGFQDCIVKIGASSAV